MGILQARFIRVGCHALLQGNLPNLGMEPRSPALQADSLLSEPPGKPLLPLVPTSQTMCEWSRERACQAHGEFQLLFLQPQLNLTCATLRSVPCELPKVTCASLGEAGVASPFHTLSDDPVLCRIFCEERHTLSWVQELPSSLIRAGKRGTEPGDVRAWWVYGVMLSMFWFLCSIKHPI